MGELVDARHLFAGNAKMSKKQAAAYLERTPRWVELRMRDAGLPFWREGHRVWFSREQLDAWRQRALA